MTVYLYVKCPNFVIRDEFGGLKTLTCKLCGSVIADTIERILRYEKTQGGQIIKVVNRQFTRLSNYREMKIAFEDSSYFHITHGCNKCFRMDLEVAILQELHAADQEESPDGYTDRERAEVPIGILILQADQSGIV